MHHPGPHEIVLHDEKERRWLHFRQPVHVYQTTALREVLPLLETVEARVESEGLWAAGFLAYEAAPAFDRALQTHAPSPTFPLLWFGLYPAPTTIHLDPAPYPPSPPLPWQPSVTPAAYEAAIAADQKADRRRANLPGQLHLPPARPLYRRPVALLP
jgi:para-aminobenzoate synthetase / 4-amino-4-deoxychorismate lyase